MPEAKAFRNAKAIKNLTGQVVLHKRHSVTASYGPVQGDGWKNYLFHSGVNLPNGRRVAFFVNRETGVVVVDIIAKSGNRGNEVLRIDANKVHV